VKVDLSKQIVGLDGVVVFNGMTMAQIAASALSSAPQSHGAAPISPEQSYKRFELAVRLVGESVTDLDDADTKLIGDAVAQNFAPLVYGQVRRALEGKEQPSFAPASDAA
jgi:hypothetical protein